MILRLEFPLSRDITTTLRLAAGGVCALVGLGIDAAEDCKVCLTESLLLLLHDGCAKAQVSFSRGERGLSVSLCGSEKGGEGERTEEEISIALLRALTEDFSIERGETTRITFGFAL